MNAQKINYLLESLRLTEEVDKPDVNNPSIIVTRRELTIKGAARDLLISELVSELSTQVDTEVNDPID